MLCTVGGVGGLGQAWIICCSVLQGGGTIRATRWWYNPCYIAFSTGTAGALTTYCKVYNIKTHCKHIRHVKTKLQTSRTAGTHLVRSPLPSQWYQTRGPRCLSDHLSSILSDHLRFILSGHPHFDWHCCRATPSKVTIIITHQMAIITSHINSAVRAHIFNISKRKH